MSSSPLPDSSATAQKPFVATTEFYVRYAETDAMGIVHHASYIIWMEEARSNYGRARGADYADFERTGYVLSTTEVHARYVAAARYADLIKARCWVETLGSRAVTFNYEILNARTEKMLVTGYSKHICLNQQGMPSVIPESDRWWLS